ISCQAGVDLVSLRIGDEFVVRHVPQSQYFQAQELDAEGWEVEILSTSHGVLGSRLARVVRPTLRSVEVVADS
ncbi:MAG: hypothetical protein ACWGSQ_12175, partial [Longimicrobiales bacterium]